MKPLFIPLKSEYFNAFKAGTKDTEYRVWGKRWNSQTCRAGRRVVLSKGYGRHERLHGVVKSVQIDYHPERLPGWKECYGEGTGHAAVCIKIDLSPKVTLETE